MYAEAFWHSRARAKALKAEGLTLLQVADRLAPEGRKTKVGTPYQFTAAGRMISGSTKVADRRLTTRLPVAGRKSLTCATGG